MSAGTGQLHNVQGGVRGYVAYLGLAVFNVSISATLLLLFANALPVEQYADFGVISSLAGLALLLVNAGHKEALFKFASQSKANELVAIAQSLQRWLLPLLALALLLALIVPTVGLAALMFLFLYVTIAVSSVFRGRAEYTKDAALWPLYRGIWLVGCFVFFVHEAELSLLPVFAIGSLAAVLTFLMLGGYSVARELVGRASFQLSWPLRDATLRQFFLIEVATIAYVKVDVLLLAFLGIPSADIASYFFSIQLFEAALLVLMPLGYLFFNRINGSDAPNLNATVLLVFGGGVFVVSLMVIAGWAVLGPALLETLFANYVSSNTTTVVLFIALLPWGLALLFSYWLIAQNRERLVASAFFVGLVLHLVLNGAFIPTWGVQGAAWARVATECAIALMLLAVAIKTGSLAVNGEAPKTPV